MIQDVQPLLERYWTWLQDRTHLREVGDCIEITTPYLDRHNDYLQIYTKRINGGFVLTDDGYILDDLELSGHEIDSSKRKAALEEILNGFGVHSNGTALEVTASAENFPLRKHNLVQAMFAVNDLFRIVSPTIANFFREDVASWLDTSGIRYISNIKFTGKTGYDHYFDFIIPKSKTQPERILQAINCPSRETAEKVVFSWADTREALPCEAQTYAILNDSERTISENVLDAMRGYDVRPVPWSAREEARNELAA